VGVFFILLILACPLNGLKSKQTISVKKRSINNQWGGKAYIIESQKSSFLSAITAREEAKK
jgi:hypothetical protein